MRKIWKSLVVLLVLLLGTGLLMSMGEYESSADSSLANATEQAMFEANSQVGYPAITNFQEKKLLKMLYELRDKSDLVCYAYIKADYSGHLVYLGECIGYRLPYSVQFSNPDKLVDWKGRRADAIDASSSSSRYTLSQPEPNGLFMPEGLSATWLMLINPETGEPQPVYVEPEIVVSPFKLQ